MTSSDNLTHKRRVVIGLQLAVLVFVLVGLFGQLAFTQEPSDVDTVDLESVAITKPAEDTWEQLTQTEVRARSVFVYDVNSKQILYEKNSGSVLPIASITKLMTSLLSYELLDQEAYGEVSRDALRQNGASGFSEGEQLRLKDLTQLALVGSSNDAAYTVANTVGAYLGPNDPTAQFVAGMNLRAKELGLDSLQFKNPTGLDLSPNEAGAVGSAKDVSLLLAHIVQTYPDLVAPTQRAATYVYSDTGVYHEVDNTNDALYLIPNLIGSKTGYTDLAGGNLTVAFDAGFNRPIVVTVLGSTRSQRFSDVISLIDAIEADLHSQ